MPGPLAAKIRAKFPGAYDDLSDADLEKQVLAKHPEYQDLATPEPPKGDTYTGPDTFMGGAMASLKDTATRTGGGIMRGMLRAVNPGPMLDALGKRSNMPGDQTVTGPIASGAQQPMDIGATAKSLTTPEGGGEMIGGLLTGLALPKVAAATGPMMQRGALRLMQGALKPTKALENARRGAGFGSKEAIAQAVLDEGRNVSAGGLRKAQDALDLTDETAQRQLQGGTGAGVTVDPFKVTKAIDEQASGRFGEQINAQPDTSAIKTVHENFATNPHVSDPVTGMADIPADQAHRFASNTGSNLKGKFGRLGGATVEAEKAGREAIVSQLRAKIPDLKDLWDAEARQITTRDALEAATARTQNRDPIGLSGITGFTKNPALGIAALLDKSAFVRSSGANLLNKAGGLMKRTPADTLRAMILAALSGSEPPQKP